MIPSKMYLALLALGMFLLNGCCWNVQCECISPGITVNYNTTGPGECPTELRSTIQVQTFNRQTDALVSSDFSSEGGTCSVFLPYEENVYWVIQSDSFAIADTIFLNNPDFQEPSKCCDCGPIIRTANLVVNGTDYNTTVLFRQI